MMEFVRAEREADWPLHIECLKAMMAYIFAAILGPVDVCQQVQDVRCTASVKEVLFVVGDKSSDDEDGVSE